MSIKTFRNRLREEKEIGRPRAEDATPAVPTLDAVPLGGASFVEEGATVPLHTAVSWPRRRAPTTTTNNAHRTKWGVTACGRFCRGDSAAGPPCSDADLVPHEEPWAFDPKIPDLAGASRRLPAARQVSAGTWRCLASGYTPVCANRSQLEPSRTPRPLWLRAFGGTEVSPCNAPPRDSLYPSAVILGTGAPRIVAPFPDMRLVKWHATCNTDARGRGACGGPRPT